MAQVNTEKHGLRKKVKICVFPCLKKQALSVVEWGHKELRTHIKLRLTGMNKDQEKEKIQVDLVYPVNNGNE